MQYVWTLFFHNVHTSTELTVPLVYAVIMHPDILYMYKALIQISYERNNYGINLTICCKCSQLHFNFTSLQSLDRRLHLGPRQHTCNYLARQPLHWSDRSWSGQRLHSTGWSAGQI